VVTTGCTEGIAAALLGLVDPGDEVVVLEPYYDSYVAMIQMAGGYAVRSPCARRTSGSTPTSSGAAVTRGPGSCC
jgi:N-succinyldiaminopimelate aminotransferase